LEVGLNLWLLLDVKILFFLVKKKSINGD